MGEGGGGVVRVQTGHIPDIFWTGTRLTLVPCLLSILRRGAVILCKPSTRVALVVNCPNPGLKALIIPKSGS
jgi:hypothetical protein